MSDAVPELSAMCAGSAHDRCPHWAGLRAPRPWRRQPAAELRLCGCPCHVGCPLAGEDTVRQETWSATCTCPGAESARESFERNQEIRRVAAAIDMSDHPDAEEIESRLRAVFEEHGQPTPPGTTTWSRLLAARAESRFASRAGYRAAGAVATAAMALTAAAILSTGRRRLLWGGAAAGAWAAAGYAVSLVTALAGIARSAEAQARVEDLPSR